MIEYNNIKELLESVEEGTIILEPQNTFNSAIIGVTHDNKHLVYDYYKIVEGFMTSDNMSEEEALDYIEYNTIRSLDYMDYEYRPIIINMV